MKKSTYTIALLPMTLFIIGGGCSEPPPRFFDEDGLTGTWKAECLAVYEVALPLWTQQSLSFTTTQFLYSADVFSDSNCVTPEPTVVRSPDYRAFTGTYRLGLGSYTPSGLEAHRITFSDDSSNQDLFNRIGIVGDTLYLAHSLYDSVDVLSFDIPDELDLSTPYLK